LIECGRDKNPISTFYFGIVLHLSCDGIYSSKKFYLELKIKNQQQFLADNSQNIWDRQALNVTTRKKTK